MIIHYYMNIFRVIKVLLEKMDSMVNQESLYVDMFIIFINKQLLLLIKTLRRRWLTMHCQASLNHKKKNF